MTEDGIRTCVVCDMQVDVGCGSLWRKYQRMSRHVNQHRTSRLWWTAFSDLRLGLPLLLAMMLAVVAAIGIDLYLNR